MTVGERQRMDRRILGALRGASAAPAAEAPPRAAEQAPAVESFGEATPAGGDEAPLNEAPLIEAARRDPAAFGVLYETYVDRIYAYIYHRVGNVQDTEDLTARTFYRALDSLDTYEDRGAPFSAWLFRIAHNLVANFHRDRSRRRFLSLDRLWFHSQEEDTPHQSLEQEEKHAALWSAISRLPEERRNLLLYKFGSQMSNLEIGALMDKSESAIKSLYFRTLAALRQDLEARGWGTGHDEAAGAAPLAAPEEELQPAAEAHGAPAPALKETA